MRFVVLGLLLIAQILWNCDQPDTAQSENVENNVAEENEMNYREKHRPQYHFTPAEKWMNDPNGMVYYEGEYHLFYQYYPDSTVWGPMHWGHAISKDLVHWEHLPIGLYPDSLGYIFSGSAVVDWNNTSGFAKDGQPPLVAIFTHHLMEGEKANRNDFQYQSIAYSNDKGRTWTKYAGNPVIPNSQGLRDFRDPKVIWDKRSDQWVMVFAAKDHIQFWGSKNLRDWNHLSDWGREYGEHGGLWECPDLFPLQVEGTDQDKWVLLVSINPGSPNGGSGTQYFIGNFDGTNFILEDRFEKDVEEGGSIWLDYGRDNYAGVTWSDVPAEDGRRIFMGWMSNWDYAQVVPTEAWRSAMTIARSLTLVERPQGYRLVSTPVKEQDNLHKEEISLAATAIDATLNLNSKGAFNPSQAEIILDIDLSTSTSKRFGLELTNAQGESYRIGYDLTQQSFFSDRTRAGDHSFSEKFATGIHLAPRQIEANKLSMQIYFDRSSVEAFADDGATVMTDLFFPNTDFNQIQFFSQEGTTKLESGMIYPLERIWQ